MKLRKRRKDGKERGGGINVEIQQIRVQFIFLKAGLRIANLGNFKWILFQKILSLINENHNFVANSVPIRLDT